MHPCSVANCGQNCWPSLQSLPSRAKAPSTPEDFWNRIHDEHGDVRSEYQFREGDYTAGFQALREISKSDGLWDVLINPKPLNDVSEKKRRKWEVLNSRAINHALRFICDSIKDRWDLSIKCPTNGHSMLKFLERTACQPFRLMDLPFELRNHVYDLCGWALPFYEKTCTGPHCRSWKELEVTDRYIPDHLQRRVIFGDRHYARSRDYWLPPELKCHERPEDERGALLSLVCREFRDAMLERQFERSKFIIDIDNNRFGDFLNWTKAVGMERLRRVRSIHVHIDWYQDYYDEFVVSYDPVGGLKVKYEHADPRWWKEKPTTLSEHVAKLSSRNVKEGWNSTGVIEFFTMDEGDALRHATWCSEYRSGIFDEDNERCEREDWDGGINERDAYDVAYGRMEVSCMW